MGKAARRERRAARPRPIAEVMARLAGYEQIAQEELGPACWERLDQRAGARGEPGVGSWPEWCWVPMASASAVVAAAGRDDEDYLGALGGATLLWHLGAWRKGRGVYRFDRDLAGALSETDNGDRLPVETLHRLPEWGCYLVLPEPIALVGGVAARLGDCAGAIAGGAFVGLESDARTGRAELRILLDVYDADSPTVAQYLLPQVLYLVPGIAVDEAHRRAMEHRALDAAGAGIAVPADVDTSEASTWMASVWTRILPLILYVCATNADFTGTGHRPDRPRRQARSDPARSGPKLVNVGWRIGADLRRHGTRGQVADQRQPGRHPAPHLRRAHWHHYWTGPRNRPEDRTLEVRWVPPTLVAGGGDTVVEHRVRCY